MSIEERHSIIAGKMIASIGGAQFGVFTWNQVRAIARSTESTAGQVRAIRLGSTLGSRGYRVVGQLESTSPDRHFWIIRIGSQGDELASLFEHPNGDSPRELAHVITKLNGRWDWGVSSPQPHQAA